MFKTKYVKHLSVIVLCVIILFTSSLSAFAESTGTFSFMDCTDRAFSYWVKNSEGKFEEFDCDDKVSLRHLSDYPLKGVSYPCTEFSYDVSLNPYKKLFGFNFPLQFLSGAEYSVNFNFAFNFGTDTQLTWFLIYSFFDGSPNESVVLHQETYRTSYTWYDFSSDFQVPNFNKSFSVSFMFLISSNGGYSSAPQMYYFSDIKITNSDDFQGPPIDNSASEQIDDINNQISSIESELPKIDADELDGLINGVNIDEYNNGFRAFNRVFDDVITALDMQAVLIFCLSFGLAIYIIGRRLRA